MNKKILLLILLLCVTFVFAAEYSVEFSLLSGVQRMRSDNLAFNFHDYHEGAEPELLNHNKLFFKPGVAIFYKSTGLYISTSNPLGHYYFNRYWMFSGGLKQSFSISEKSSLGIHVGSTWHSVDAAIHSFLEFFTSVKYTSLPGLDVGIEYKHKVLESVSIVLGINYNYNKQYSTIGGPIYIEDPQFYFQTISLNAGISYTLF